MEISKRVNLDGRKVAFLVPEVDHCLNNSPIKAMQELLDRGLKFVKTMTLEEASKLLAEIQEKHKIVPPDQIFLKVTSKGVIDQLFC